MIFYLHGNAGNLANRAGRFRRFIEHGYGLIALAYPGSSGSAAPPSEERLLQAATLAWLKKPELLPDTYKPHHAPKTLIYGESLGAAVAIALNASPASDSAKGVGPADALILEAPFTSIKALAEHHYPRLTPLHAHLDGTWESLATASQIRQPLFILHGTEDSLIPIDMGQQLLSAAPSHKKQLVEVPGAGHTDLWRTDTLPKLYSFMDQFASQ